ncbi:MAG: alpha-glucan family phosphorylase [Chlamydiales bacterium]|nr:alpha-glucan family phosphorylase [Chlamydiales bacterium]
MDRYRDLTDLALDLKSSSSFFADELWSCLDQRLWNLTRNPWILLQSTPRNRIDELLATPQFLALLDQQIARRNKAANRTSWFEQFHQGKFKKIAYFSMEYGLSEALPIYSGGLGILAGDHLKSCSDLGVPIVGIGLLYQQGFFRQSLTVDGEQRALYPYNEPGQLPLKRLDVRIPLQFPGRKVWLRVHRAKIGKVDLYLLDSNDLLNFPVDRAITSELYGGDTLMRLQQEIVLGIGGVKLLDALAIEADFFHLNEGHAALAIWERAKKGSIEQFKGSTLFTTHTPVAAGFDRFEKELMRPFFDDLDQLFPLGAEGHVFNMATFASKCSGYMNGVSQLHGLVSQKLFPDREVGYVTNGVHFPSWESPASDLLWKETCGEMRWLGELAELDNVRHLPDAKIKQMRNQNRQTLVDYAHSRLQLTLERIGQKFTPFLRPDVFTIGFARRFTAYKRVDMLLKDQERLLNILQNQKRPVQLIVAGKAHPADQEGQALVKKWVEFIRRPEVRPHAVFLTDYDILVAERLVQGVDLWVNTPMRPWEASGTSGMKVLANGGLNFSVLDGWWAEAYHEAVGFALEDESKLYDQLENTIIPLFYSDKWTAKVKESMAQLTPQYSTNRMVREYTEKYYVKRS